MKYVSDIRFVDPFRNIRIIRDQSRKLSSRRILDVFLPSQILGALQKFYPHYYPCFAARRMEKFRKDIPTCSDDGRAHAEF